MASTKPPRPRHKTMEVQIAWLEEVPEGNRPKRKGPPRLPGARATLPPMPVSPSIPPLERSARTRHNKTIEVEMSWLDFVDESKEAKASEAKAKETKANETKTNEAKANETKANEAKAKETKTNEANAKEEAAKAPKKTSTPPRPSGPARPSGPPRPTPKIGRSMPPPLPVEKGGPGGSPPTGEKATTPQPKPRKPIPREE